MPSTPAMSSQPIPLRFDALKRAEGASKLGGHHYVPVLHVHGDKVGKREKVLLALHGLALAGVQGNRPAAGAGGPRPYASESGGGGVLENGC